MDRDKMIQEAVDALFQIPQTQDGPVDYSEKTVDRLYAKIILTELVDKVGIADSAKIGVLEGVLYFEKNKNKALQADLNEAMELLDIFFGNCTYSKEHPTGYDSEISKGDYNRLLDFKERIIKKSRDNHKGGE